MRQRNGGSAADVGMEAPVHHEHSAPDQFALLADALQRSSAQGKVHRGLPLTDRAGVPRLEMRGRDRARNLERPDEVAAVLGLVQIAAGIDGAARDWIDWIGSESSGSNASSAAPIRVASTPSADWTIRTRSQEGLSARRSSWASIEAAVKG